MPSKTKLKNAAIAARSAALPSISKELIDQFVTGPMSAEAVNAALHGFQEGPHRARAGPSSAITWVIRVATPSRMKRSITATARAARPC